MEDWNPSEFACAMIGTVLALATAVVVWLAACLVAGALGI